MVEIAIVLVVLGLLLAGFLGPLSVRVEQQQRAKTQEMMEEIKEALLGFAAIHGYLPCPTGEPNPISPAYGEARSSCVPGSAGSDGYLPWKTLGVSPIDAWGRVRDETDALFLGYWRYRIDGNFNDSDATDGNSHTPITLDTVPVENLKVVDAGGNLLTSASEPPIAIVFSTGADLELDGENASYNGTYQAGDYRTDFDDITTWLSRPLLYNRLIMAGKLP